MKYLEIAANINRGSDWISLRDIPVISGTGVKNNIIVHDLRNLPIPIFVDNMFDGVYNEHFIEHLDKQSGINFLSEMYRILKPGGVLRTIWPSMDFLDILKGDTISPDYFFVKEYYERFILSGQFTPTNKESSIKDQVISCILHQDGEHKYVWYVEELRQKLKDIGFSTVNSCNYLQSSYSFFNNIEVPSKIRKEHSAVLEAIK